MQSTLFALALEAHRGDLARQAERRRHAAIARAGNRRARRSKRTD